MTSVRALALAIAILATALPPVLLATPLPVMTAAAPLLDLERPLPDTLYLDDSFVGPSPEDESILAGERFTVFGSATFPSGHGRIRVAVNGETLSVANATNDTSLHHILDLPALPPALGDDFANVTINGEDWTVTGAEVSDDCGAASSPNALVFDGAGPRVATTRPVDVRAGGTLVFDLRFGDAPLPALPDVPGVDHAERLVQPCPGPADEGEVVVEYSVDAGASWATLAGFDAAGGDARSWERVELVLPEAAASQATLLRLTQPSPGIEGRDVWALDDVAVEPTLHRLEVVAADAVTGGEARHEVAFVTEFDPIIATSDLEDGGVGWTFNDPAGTDSVAITSAARRLGDNGLEIVATSDAGTPSATFTLDKPVDRGHYWAFVRVPAPPTNGALTVLQLNSASGGVSFAIRVDSSMQVLALDTAGWINTDESIMPGSWIKFEVSDAREDLELLIDNKLVGIFSRSATGPVTGLTFAGQDAASTGTLHVDDVAVTQIDTITRNILEDNAWSMNRWTSVGTGSDYGVERDPEDLDWAMRINSSDVSPVVLQRSLWAPTTKSLWVSLSVGAFNAGCGAGPGNILNVEDDAQSLIVGIRCMDGRMEAFSEGLWIPMDASPSANSYTRVLVQIEAGRYAVAVDDRFVGDFNLINSGGPSVVSIGGGEADLWYNEILVERGPHGFVDGFDGHVGSSWAQEVTDGAMGVTVEVDEGLAFTGNRSFAVHSLGVPGEVGQLRKSVVAPPFFHLEARIYVPELVFYHGFYLLSIDDDDVLSTVKAGVRVVTGDDGRHRLSLDTGGTISTTSTEIEPGWNRIGIRANMLGPDPHWTAFIDGIEITTLQLQSTSPVIALGLGDLYRGLLQATGSGLAYIDDVVLTARNYPPTIEVEGSGSSTRAVGAQVEVLGVEMTDPDFGDGIDALIVKVFEGSGYYLGAPSWTPIPKGPEWIYSWDTTGLEPGTYTVAAVAVQGNRADVATRTFELVEP